ncbi:MAG: NnrS family protein [Hyphomicrobiales bacterium]|nr:MAG: NnrS family protein [Hyphomicrobiales bacterium]
MANSDIGTRPQGGFKPPLFVSAGFRFFFLSAGIFAVFALAAWMLWLAIHAANGMVVEATINVAPHYWHAHEMIFGYGAAVVSGFFLTAVPNWTGEPTARARFVAVVGAVWLAGRLAIWFSTYLPAPLIAFVDLVFLPPLIARVAWNMRRNPQPRNLVFIGVLAAFVVANLMVHLEWIGVTSSTLIPGLYFGLTLLAVMITIIGGRVVPAFTRNALRRGGEEVRLPVSRAWSDRAGILTAVILALTVALDLPDVVIGIAAAAAAAANGIRLSAWRWQDTLHDPILWSLHLGFGMLVLGFATLSCAYLFEFPSTIGAYHVLGIGAVGGMTLAVMTRASLGHTGRALKVAPSIGVAYAVIGIAALVRGFGTDLFPAWYNTVIFTSGLLWIAGFTIFSVVYWPILTGPDARG